MAKKRVYEMAKELGLSNKEVVEKLKAMGFNVKSHSSSLEEVEAEAALRRIRGGEKPAAESKKVATPAGVVRRRRRKVSAEGEAVVTETEVTPGKAGEEVVLKTVGGAELAAADEAAAAAAELLAEKEAEAERAESMDVQVATEPEATPDEAAPGETVLSEPTATQAVVVSRPLIPVAPKIPPGPRTPGATGPRRIGPVKEYRVVTDSLGRGREFVDVTKDKTGKKKAPGGARRAKAAFSKRELLSLARERAYIPVRGRKRRPTKKGKKTEVTEIAAHKRVVRIEETIQVADLAKEMGVRLVEVVRKLMQLGTPATANQYIDIEAATVVAAEFDYEVHKTAVELGDIIDTSADADENLEPRPAVITVMGHVDHGKTSLLDYIRKSNVAEGESGGITQHIGAYSVKVGDETLTFIDTPGHEAFTAMRARGAQITDLIILVVAADDSIMPQTVEAINHAKAAGVPIVVAVNKCDLPSANPERVRQALTEHELVPEEWGGETIVVDISAKTGDGIDKLLEMVHLQAEVLDLKANPKNPAKGVVIEAQLVKGRGPTATVLVQDGTVRKGDVVYCGSAFGKLRMLENDRGEAITEAGPGTPVRLQGLDGIPDVGQDFFVVTDEKVARDLSEKQSQLKRQAGLKGDAADFNKKSTLEELLAQMKGNSDEQKNLRVILKSDVQGSIEAVAGALEKLSTDKVKVTFLHKQVGAITESDVVLATAAKALVVGFNSKPDAKARKIAGREGVDIRTYKVIYDAVDDVRLVMEGLLEPVRTERHLGRAEVLNVFRIRGKGTIAGCNVTEGKLLRAAFIRILRDEKPLHEGKIDGLKRFKDDVKEVPSGMECGVSFSNFNDVQAGDIIEAFEVEEQRASL